MKHKQGENPTTTTPIDSVTTVDSAAPKHQTAVYLTSDIRARLGRYLLDKYAGQLNVRNRVILESIDEKLTKEGY